MAVYYNNAKRMLANGGDLPFTAYGAEYLSLPEATPIGEYQYTLTADAEREFPGKMVIAPNATTDSRLIPVEAGVFASSDLGDAAAHLPKVGNGSIVTAPLSANWQRFLADGAGKILGIGWSFPSSRDCLFSTDNGATWQTTALPTAGRWGGGAYCPAFGWVVTSGDASSNSNASSYNTAAFSVDGQLWSATTLPQSGSWEAVTATDTTVIAISYNSSNLARTTDGQTWQHITVPSRGWVSATYGAGTIAVIAKTGHVMLSTDDGQTWTDELPDGSGTKINVGFTSSRSIAFKNGLFVSASNTNIAFSEDGFTWEILENIFPTTLTEWIVSATTDEFIAVVGSQIARSAHGHSWFFEPIPNGASGVSNYTAWPNAVAIDNGGWVTANSGQIIVMNYDVSQCRVRLPDQFLPRDHRWWLKIR